MTGILIIAGIVAVILIIRAVNNQGGNKNEFIEIKKDIDEDIMPEGYGEFGLEKTNPIPASSIPHSYFYIGRLRTQNGSEITYNRIGSFGAPNISHPIDGYSISSNGQKLATVYICPYNKKTSTKAPKGFMLS